jgi:hypothetical protein
MTHLLVITACDDQPVHCRVLDFGDSAAYPCLTKELGYRCVASHPEMAGEPFQVFLEALPAAGGQSARIRMEGWAPPPESRLLGSLDVPAERFAWLGAATDPSLESGASHTVHLAVANADHPVVQQASCYDDNDFALEQDPDPLRLPGEFSTRPLGSRRVVRNSGTWMCCVFAPGVYRHFAEAASTAGPDANERGWLGQVRVHLTGGRLYVLVDNLVEVPALRSGPSFIHTSGSQFFRVYRDHARLGAYLHLHPRRAAGVELGPHPSAPDATLAWDLQACVPYPVIMPIAMFGLRADGEHEDLAVSAYSNGQLTEIDWEVLLDE